MTLRCRHVCQCGAVLICGEPDKCAAGKDWQCHACELDAVDDFLNQQAQLLEETELGDLRIGQR